MAGLGFSEALNVSPWMARKADQIPLTLHVLGAGNSKSDLFPDNLDGAYQAFVFRVSIESPEYPDKVVIFAVV